MTRAVGWRRGAPMVVTLFTGALMAAVGLLFCFWLFWPYNPLAVSSIVVPSPQHSGTPIDYKIAYCRNTALPATVVRTIVGVGKTSYNFPYAPVGSITTPGCKSTHVVIPLTTGIPTGTYVLHVAATFKVNPFRSVSTDNHSNVFVIRGAAP